jgi:nucleotide-binding universal stress UspA family protein
VRLLVGLDDSDRGRDALALARVLCMATGSGALVVTVPFGGPVPTSFELVPEAGDLSARPHLEETREKARPLLDEVRAALAGLEVETRIYVGSSPAAVLTTLAEREDAAGIVIGSPRLEGVNRLILGSTAISLLNGASADVFIAPPGYAGRRHDGLATVAVAYLGTPESKAALKKATRLLDRDGTIELLTVVEPPVPLSLEGEDLTNPIDPDRVIAEGLEAVPPEVRVDARRLDGAAAPELERACAEGVDLLVVGSRGYGPLRRTLLGSVSGHVFRHAPCPVLVARRP